MITVMDAQKKYMEIDLGGFGFGPGAARGFPPAAAASGASAATPPKIEKTGHHETIAGHDCEDWNLVDANNHKALLCMASDVGAFDFGGMEGASFLPDLVKHGLFGASAFPLKLVDYDNAGKEKTHIEVTRIERKTEDDALFAPPAGYAKFEYRESWGDGRVGCAHAACTDSLNRRARPSTKRVPLSCSPISPSPRRMPSASGDAGSDVLVEGSALPRRDATSLPPIAPTARRPCCARSRAAGLSCVVRQHDVRRQAMPGLIAKR